MTTKKTKPHIIERTAHISVCGKYRYLLSRIWDKDKTVAVFIGLNPSTADATKDDPTIRRCVDFAYKWGYGGLVMVNLFAYRTTDPKKLPNPADECPIGPQNHKILTDAIKSAGIVVLAWGNPGHGTGIARSVCNIAMTNRVNLYMLGANKNGSPKHPLYAKSKIGPTLKHKNRLFAETEEQQTEKAVKPAPVSPPLDINPVPPLKGQKWQRKGEDGLHCRVMSDPIEGYVLARYKGSMPFLRALTLWHIEYEPAIITKAKKRAS